ncbi:hypothetical protein Golax_005275 [Gossypium laxum]|uniref:DUF7745 domain-containing protein n=1 Tax=Gossypium laxum TaxID=34288 RepID=A0A7J9A086_9ROSI|nr:hypothetical protein [Gossypium laxum]
MEKGFLDKVEDNAANDEVRQLFYSNYGDLPYLLDMKVDKHLFRALAQFWNPAYSCFTFEKVDLVPTIEEYMALLCCSKIQVNKTYSRAVNVLTFLKKLMNITGISKQWVTTRIKQKGDRKCIPWKNLKHLILAHPNTKNKVDLFALSIYGLVVFPKALGHVDDAVTGLFDRLDKRVTLVPVILAETFRSQIRVEKRGKADLLDVRSSYSHGFIVIFSLQEENIKWIAPWLLPDEILYRCGDFDWVPLVGIWGAIGYAPLLEDSQSIEEHLRVVHSKLEIIRQDFERRNAELEKKIEQMEEEKMNLRLDMDVQKLDLKTDYKKLHLSMRTAELGKTSKQWHQEIQEEKIKVDRWEKKFQEVQMRNETLEKSLSES